MGFLVIGVLAGVMLLYVPRLHRWGRRWLVLLVLAYMALGMPIVSGWLEGRERPTYSPITSKAQAGNATAIVVLGNGSVTYTDGTHQISALTRRSSFNVMEGARLSSLFGDTQIVLTGGIVDPGSQQRAEADLMADAIVAMGVPRRRIVLDVHSTNTYEQSVRVAQLLAPHAACVVVTTPIHMRRTLELFKARGLQPIPSPSAIEYVGPPQSTLIQFVPNPFALRASELVMYEYLATVNGQARGWLNRSDAPE
jgi:uncharacterized SAM-binding protein YcdF (DUF218 family)